MQLVSFDIFRTLGFPNTQVIKPEHIFKYKTELSQADWVLFPEYWQLNALVYGLGCRIFPSEASYRIGHNKIEMTRAFEMVVPDHVPVTLIEPNGPLQREQIWQTMTLPFVVKIPKASMGEGVWLVQNHADWLRYCERTDVLYAQEYLPIDRDIRVVVVGDQVLTAYWRHQAAQGFYNNVARGGWIEQAPVPDSAVALALHLARTLGVNHAGFDIAMVGSHPYVLEFNRLFGNQGLTEGGRLREVILSYLQSYEQPEDPDHPTRPPKLPIAV
ncbi:ATP-grasp domain-containing protein [Gynuella sunshinyii]|uniref:Glutathione synthase/Ribosomal protein S6 modification enzyme (Glutaminyl transferase) n=1 Tax=Gynuella sunshinyii YC6258 TaxID=1445510 RepID=A0A0C5VK81_9GAMM|nr:alpha-L-glutamate ligase [Gynuella sunshinyii]AJQ93763.1 glutathione synthase/Ribosomal protein S6 modification enzyme (glutaminyl transferase) [Gynuella sunshinyii YC6258]